MKPTSKSVRAAEKLIIADFNLPGFPEQVTDISSLIEHVSKEVAYMLDHRFEFLMNALYRIDVDEKAVKNVLSVSRPDAIAHDLAVLIVDREITKIRTREKYRPENQ